MPVSTIPAVAIDDASGTGTGAMSLPTGTTAQRPTGSAGLFRFNTTAGKVEWYNTSTSSWQSI